jgi:hypothetical protein
MPGYVSNVLSKFQHDTPKHPQHTPSRYGTPVYGAKTQYAMKDETRSLTAKQCLTIQKITGSILYYARAVDPTVLMPLNDIVPEQSKATKKTQAATNQMLDYISTHSDAAIRYHASDIILLLNFSHSRNPRARPHGRTDESKRPESHPTKECARACVRCLKTEPNYYYCTITLVMS